MLACARENHSTAIFYKRSQTRRPPCRIGEMERECVLGVQHTCEIAHYLWPSAAHHVTICVWIVHPVGLSLQVARARVRALEVIKRA